MKQEYIVEEFGTNGKYAIELERFNKKSDATAFANTQTPQDPDAAIRVRKSHDK